MRNLKNKFLAAAFFLICAVGLASAATVSGSIPYFTGPLLAADQVSSFNILITEINQLFSQVNGGQPFGSYYSSNPLLADTQQTIPIASVNAVGGYTFLNGGSARTIYPQNVVVTAIGGNAATSTGIKVLCTSGNVLASIAIAQLTSGVPTSAFSASVTPGIGLTGCALGDGVLVSNVGSNLATTTSLIINMPYTIQ